MRKLSSIIAVGLLLSACHAEKHLSDETKAAGAPIQEYRAVSPKNGIDFYAVKDNRKDPDCFYMGHGDLPPWDSKSYPADVVPVLIGSNSNGVEGFQRLNFTPPTENALFTQADFLQLINSENFEELETQLSQLDESYFTPRPLNDREFGIAERAGKPNPNPLDIVIPYHSRIIFILTNPSQKFYEKAPFRVAVGVPNAVSPFYGPPKVSDGGKVMEVKYLSLPQRKELDWDYIKNRKCIYYYELSVLQRTQDSRGRPLEVLIHIDPDGEGEGTPPPGFPPVWP